MKPVTTSSGVALAPGQHSEQELLTEANSSVRKGAKWALIYWPKAVLKDREVRLEEMNLKC
jgi:hypothetical protein